MGGYGFAYLARVERQPGGALTLHVMPSDESCTVLGDTKYVTIESRVNLFAVPSTGPRPRRLHR